MRINARIVSTYLLTEKYAKVFWHQKNKYSMLVYSQLVHIFFLLFADYNLSEAKNA